MTAQTTQNMLAARANGAPVDPQTQPLAWGRHCDVFALRLRERPPQPPTRRFEFLKLNSRQYLSNTTLKVIDALISGDLSRIRSETLADSLRISPTTLRRRLGKDNLNYQSILDAARRYRCEEKLADAWVPGKCLAWELGYAEVNSFYRAFRRWTGRNYSEIKLLLI
jgi:AraC family mar-sox-rob regulon transcriptional activator